MINRTLLFECILDTCDFLEAQGVDVSPVIKRRDPIEPGRRRKEKAEDDLFALMMSYFRAQKKHIKEFLGNKWPTRKQVETPPELEFILADFNGDPFMKKLKLLLMKAARDGVLLFSELVPMGIDYTLVNVAAADWAREYAGDLIKGIDETTLDDVRSAVSMFIETPGMTIGDTMSALSITGAQAEMRSLRIAVTEITNAYATAEQMAGEKLQEEFPDVRVIKRWWTNNDDLVCVICGPLHGEIVGIGESFTTDLGDDNIVVNKRPPAHPNCRCWLSTTTDITGELGREIEFISATTTSAAEQYASDVLGMNANYTSLTTQQANAINRSIFEAQGFYSGSASQIEYIKIQDSLKSIARHDGKGIIINPKLFTEEFIASDNASWLNSFRRSERRLSTLKNKLTDVAANYTPAEIAKIEQRIVVLERRISNSSGIWGASTSLEDVVIHEVGHGVQLDLLTGEVPEVTDFLAPSKQRELGLDPTESLGMRLEGIAHSDGFRISEYATTNSEEYFAEAWVMFTKGNTQAINPDLLSIFKTIIR